MKDYYQILGITPKAGQKEIKDAYRRMARLYHPDSSVQYRQRDDGTLYFLEIQEAYDTLSNPVRKKEYDKEYWLLGKGLRTGPELNASLVLEQCKSAAMQVRRIHEQRVDQEALTDYLLHLFPDPVMVMLRREPDGHLLNQIAEELYNISVKLKANLFEEIVSLVTRIQPGELILQKFKDELTRKKKQQTAEKNMPYLFLGIILVFFFMMLLILRC